MKAEKPQARLSKKVLHVKEITIAVSIITIVLVSGCTQFGTDEYNEKCVNPFCRSVGFDDSRYIRSWENIACCYKLNGSEVVEAYRVTTVEFNVSQECGRYVYFKVEECP